MIRYFSLGFAVFNLMLALTAEAKHFSADEEMVNAYFTKCSPVPSEEVMRNEIPKLIAKAKYTPVLQKAHANIKDVEIDGLHLQGMSERELALIATLTQDRYAQRDFWRKWYSETQTAVTEGGRTFVKITRVCRSFLCKDLGVTEGKKLRRFSRTPACASALCAAESLFGKDRALPILWSYLKFGHNLSPYSSVTADPSGLTKTDLRAILAAQTAVPPAMKPDVLLDSGFFRFLKGGSLNMYGEKSIIANADGELFDPFDRLTDAAKFSIILHELGHRSARMNRGDYDSSEGWRQATGWTRSNGKPLNFEKSGWVSEYAKESASEDYAETFVLYRLNPERLRRVSPKRYEFMRTNVFIGLEYTENLCDGSIPAARNGSAETHRPSTNLPKSKPIVR